MLKLIEVQVKAMKANLDPTVDSEQQFQTFMKVFRHTWNAVAFQSNEDQILTEAINSFNPDRPTGLNELQREIRDAFEIYLHFDPRRIPQYRNYSAACDSEKGAAPSIPDVIVNTLAVLHKLEIMKQVRQLNNVFELCSPTTERLHEESVNVKLSPRSVRRRNEGQTPFGKLVRTAAGFRICQHRKGSQAPDCSSAIIPDGRYSFVIDMDGDVILEYDKREKPELRNMSLGSHAVLGLFLPVRFAGELVFAEGELREWNNKSGSYRCDKTLAEKYKFFDAKFIPEE